MSDVILTAEKDGADAEALVGFIDGEPIDRLFDGQMSQARKKIVMTLVAPGGGGKPVCR